MSVAAPALSGVSPQSGEQDVLLRPAIHLQFAGPSLIDPRSWGPSTFAVYGPGDATFDDSGPGTILDRSILADPYTLIDGAVTRERVPGTFSVYTEGSTVASGIVTSGMLGSSTAVVHALFTPTVPFNADTEYTAVLVGDDASWPSSTETFPGVTSWTSDAAFTPESTPVGSGTLTVVASYTRTFETALYDAATGYNDTFRVAITSDSATGAPSFLWSRLSSPGGPYTGSGAGPHTLPDGLQFTISGTMVSGDVYLLDTYIPKALPDSYSWSFSTGPASLSGVLTPPTVESAGNLVFEPFSGGGFAISSSDLDTGLSVVAIDPPNLDYAIDPELEVITVEFNKALDPSSGDLGSVDLIASPILGLPTTSGTRALTPVDVQVSGVFLKIWFVIPPS